MFASAGRTLDAPGTSKTSSKVRALFICMFVMGGAPFYGFMVFLGERQPITNR